MQNMGTWNSTMALVFGCFFAFPFCLMILSEIIGKLPQPKTITKVKYVQLPTKVEYVKTPPETIYKTKYVEKVVYKNKPKPKKITPVIPQFSQIEKDAVSALRTIGITKADANNLVNLKFNPDKHTDFESLFRDCMSG